MPNRLIHETSPVPSPARAQPGRLVRVGRRGIRAKRALKTSRCSFRSGIRPATGVTSWSASRSRTSRSRRSSIANFVSIKVDREERPDIDTIYMQAVQLMTGHGGWPMSMFLTPDGRPFFGGTYFPPEDRHGAPGFKRVLQHVAETYRSHRKDVEEAGEEVRRAVGASLQPEAGVADRHRGFSMKLPRASHRVTTPSTADSAARRNFRRR